VLEKGSEIGAHILSGAVVDPRALDELLPDWREQDCPLAEVPVRDNRHWFLTRRGTFSVPHWLTPGWMHNKGTYTGSLGTLCRWLAGKAEEMGVEIFPGFPAAEVLYDEQGAVRGVATGDMGVGRDGSPNGDYQPGMELHARYTLFAEGARGHLSRQVIARYALDAGSAPQVYGLGIKELWDIAPDRHQPGLVLHTQGWPLTDAYGGAFSIIRPTGRWPWALSPGWAIAIRISRPLASSSGGSSIPRSAPFWRAASACPMVRGSLTRAVGRACRNWPSRAACWSVARRAL
jgi:electron-transferring-flavoprotein dehydrogenase